VFGWRIGDAAFVEIDAIVTRHAKDPVGPAFMAPPHCTGRRLNAPRIA
jgi:hypothetical protein